MRSKQAQFSLADRSRELGSRSPDVNILDVLAHSLFQGRIGRGWIEQGLGEAHLIVGAKPDDPVVFNDALRRILGGAHNEIGDAAAFQLCRPLE